MFKLKVKCENVPKDVEDQMTEKKLWDLVIKEPKLLLTVVKEAQCLWTAKFKDDKGRVVHDLILGVDTVRFRGVQCGRFRVARQILLYSPLTIFLVFSFSTLDRRKSSSSGTTPRTRPSNSWFMEDLSVAPTSRASACFV